MRDAKYRTYSLESEMKFAQKQSQNKADRAKCHRELGGVHIVLTELREMASSVEVREHRESVLAFGVP